ncbi:MAG: hypothetical protein V3T70_08850 [Phycisphaerae bacterium]
MIEPLQPVTPRTLDDAAAMTVPVQANLVALKVESSRRVKRPSDQHAIGTPPPGAVMRFRDALIDRRAIRSYSDAELTLRTRQAWGEFSLLCWMFHVDDPHRPPNFAEHASGAPCRCLGVLLEKEAEIARQLWRLQHEQRLRFDAEARSDPGFQSDHESAQMASIRVNGVDVRLCSAEALLPAACETAGMLGAVRWLIDDRRAWGEPGIMALGTGSDSGT